MPTIKPVAWKKGEIIRNKKNGKPYLVVHVFPSLATMIVDIGQHELQIPVLLLQRDYGNYDCDVNMECIENNSFAQPDIIKWYDKEINI